MTVYDNTDSNSSDNAFCRMNITSGGIACDAPVDSGGWVYVSAAEAADPPLFTQDNDPVQPAQTQVVERYIRWETVAVYENELYLYASVNERGNFYVLSGGTAAYTAVNTYGVSYEDYGGMHVTGGGTAYDTTVGGLFAFLHVSSGAVANGVTINNDGRADASSCGIINDAEVNPGGWFYVFSGGTANRTTIHGDASGVYVCSSGVMNDVAISSGGALHISSGGTMTGRMNIEDGAHVSAFSGAIIDFDLSGAVPGAEARLNGLRRISGWEKAVYTLTVSSAQPDGTYTLAEDASGYNIPLQVRAVSGDRCGTLAVGGVLLTEDRRYSLALDPSGVLTMTQEKQEGAYTGEIIADGMPLCIDSGSFEQNLIGGTSCSIELSAGPMEVGGTIETTIDGGDFSRNLYGADRILSGSLNRTGDIHTTINGGTFSGYVVGGLCFNQKTNVARATLNGNVCTTITGGVFNGKGIYGGCIAANQNSSMQTCINGNVSIIFRPDENNTISVQGHVYAGSYRRGKINGNVSVVLSGAGTVAIAGEIWGGCSGDFYEIGDGGNRTFISSINGSSDRLLSFTGFTGNLTCRKIRGFESIEFAKDNNGISTHTSLSDSGYDLSDVRNWSFEYGCDVPDGDFANDFTGDTLTLTGLPEKEDFADWTILANSREGAFSGFGSELTVYLGSQEMSWNAELGCFLGDGCRLALENTAFSVSMVLTKHPA